MEQIKTRTSFHIQLTSQSQSPSTSLSLSLSLSHTHTHYVMLSLFAIVSGFEAGEYPRRDFKKKKLRPTSTKGEVNPITRSGLAFVCAQPFEECYPFFVFPSTIPSFSLYFPSLVLSGIENWSALPCLTASVSNQKSYCPFTNTLPHQQNNTQSSTFTRERER